MEGSDTKAFVRGDGSHGLLEDVSGEVICMTGSGPRHRDELASILEAAGARVMNGLGKEATLLLVNRTDTRKAKAAVAKGIRVLRYEEIFPVDEPRKSERGVRAGYGEVVGFQFELIGVDDLGFKEGVYKEVADDREWDELDGNEQLERAFEDADGVAVPKYGEVKWRKLGRVSLLWPNHNNPYDHPMTELEYDEGIDRVKVTYRPAYKPYSRAASRSDPITATFGGERNADMVGAIRTWVQGCVNHDPLVATFTREDAEKKLAKHRVNEEAAAANLAREIADEKNIIRNKGRSWSNWVKREPFSDLEEVAVINVGTTGFNPDTDRIVEIAVIRGHIRDDNMRGLMRRANPGIRITKKASGVHGITNDDVEDEDSFSELAREFREFIGNRTIICHNSKFDTGFLNAEFGRAGVAGVRNNPTYCTLKRLRDIFPDLKGSLDAAAFLLGESRSGDMLGALGNAFLIAKLAKFLNYLDAGEVAEVVPDDTIENFDHWREDTESPGQPGSDYTGKEYEPAPTRNLDELPRRGVGWGWIILLVAIAGLGIISFGG